MKQKEFSSPFNGISQPIIDHLAKTQQLICNELELFEPTTTFQTDYWERPEGGGGRSCVLEHGATFEKAGVNISAIHGQISTDKEANMFNQLLNKINKPTINLNQTNYLATGISLVIHPKNPFVPTVHMNYRYFELQTPTESIWWFGGGTDLTPYYMIEEDAKHFHSTLKGLCDQSDTSYYPTFKQQCDTYFYLPHRNEHRGIGGIFYDYLHTQSQEHYFTLMKNNSTGFITAYCPIVKKNYKTPYTKEHRNWQCYRRGRYVEFNLLYDRGTLFGLKTNGRIESIFMSLPPCVHWNYNHLAIPNSHENKTEKLLQSPPRNWA